MYEEFWLVTTEHLTDRLWFKDKEDFKTAMNIVALLSVMRGVQIMAFILMSNHVHFVLCCDKKTAMAFIISFKKRYSQYYSHKYGSRELLRRNGIDFKRLEIADESFERAVAYVQMNCVAANICIHPSDYLWGSGNSFFRTLEITGTLVEDFSKRACARLVHSREKLPDNYVVNSYGFIDPNSYIPFRFVESVFRTPKRMAWFLQNSSKAKRIGEAPSFNDQLVATAIKDLSVSLFRKRNISDLSEAESAELFRQIKYRFSSEPAQIARVCGVSYDKVCTMLERF